MGFRPKTVKHNFNYRMHAMKPLKTKISSSCRSSRLSSKICQAITIAIAALIINGCSDRLKQATQVVAKVNDDEISVHQVNNALAGMQRLSPESVSPEIISKARKEALTKLVNEQLAVQQAIAQKLDRSPAVMMQIDAAKREILTRAYLGQLVANLPKPSAEDIKKFYNDHPELFAQRRIYNLQEISLKNPHPSLNDLQKLVAGKSMADIAEALKKENVAYSRNSGTRAAEQIALPMLTELAKLKDGQTSVIETPQVVAIVHIDTSQLAPVNEEIALQHIPQFLMNEQAKVAINDNIDRLRRQAKIVYMNEFKDGAQPTGTQTAVAAPASQPVAETKSTSNNSVERGLAVMH